jgi:G protein beta subunit-like protein
MTNQPLLVSAAQDATIRFWDTATGNQKCLVQHKDSQVNCMAISPDNYTLTAASWERVRMYDINNLTRQNIPTFTVHEKNVTTLGYQAEGIWIYTGGEDGMVKIWDTRENQINCQRIFQVCSALICIS